MIRKMGFPSRAQGRLPRGREELTETLGPIERKMTIRAKILT
jgi:hypothetical protein